MLLPDYLLINASADVVTSKTSPQESVVRALEPPSVKYVLKTGSLRKKDDCEESCSYQHTLNFSLGASSRPGCPNLGGNQCGEESAPTVARTTFANLRMLPQELGKTQVKVLNDANHCLTESMMPRLWNPIVPEQPRSPAPPNLNATSGLSGAGTPRRSTAHLDITTCDYTRRRSSARAASTSRNASITSLAPKSPIPSLHAVALRPKTPTISQVRGGGARRSLR